MDARIIWDDWGGDLAIISGDVLLTDGLETAVILSLFLDARARDDAPCRMEVRIVAAGGLTTPLP